MRITCRARIVLIALLLPLIAPSISAAAQPADRMAWFNDARFGMFIHWGLYAVPAGQWGDKTNYAEWIQLQAKIPGAEYEKLTTQFNPVKFDAQEWVRVAKDAGMKYIVITAKHHDGFCLFDSKLTDYDVIDATPFRRDIIRELADATRAAGLTFCVYYSVPDWHNRDFPAEYSQRGFHGDPNPDADLDKYVTYVKGQVRELLTSYGPIGILWFDGGGSFPGNKTPGMAELMHSQEIVDLIRELQPNCLVNNRLRVPADYGTPEQKIPGSKQAKAFEVCMTLNRHWGYNKSDNNWKESKEVIRNLVDIASKGGNYLLNVGPTAEGTFPPDSVRILAEVGKWMRENGESIYGTTASPLANVPAWGRVTQKGSRLFLHVFDRPADGKLKIGGLPSAAKNARLLSDKNKQSLGIERDGDSTTVTLPTASADTADTVVVLEL